MSHPLQLDVGSNKEDGSFAPSTTTVFMYALTLGVFVAEEVIADCDVYVTIGRLVAFAVWTMLSFIFVMEFVVSGPLDTVDFLPLGFFWTFLMDRMWFKFSNADTLKFNLLFLHTFALYGLLMPVSIQAAQFFKSEA